MSIDLVIDIETYPNLELVDLLPPVQADSRLKDVDKIKADIHKKQAEQVQKMALNPLYGKIACIGYRADLDEEVQILDERDMLDNLLTKISGKHVITYNGRGFDFDFIAKRCAILGLKPLSYFDNYRSKYNNGSHTDIMLLWCGYGKYEKLETLSKIILGSEYVKEDFDVEKISEYLKSDTGCELLRRYCLRDCELTWLIGKRLLYGN